MNKCPHCESNKLGQVEDEDFYEDLSGKAAEPSEGYGGRFVTDFWRECAGCGEDVSCDKKGNI